MLLHEWSTLTMVESKFLGLVLEERPTQILEWIILPRGEPESWRMEECLMCRNSRRLMDLRGVQYLRYFFEQRHRMDGLGKQLQVQAIFLRSF